MGPKLHVFQVGGGKLFFLLLLLRAKFFFVFSSVCCHILRAAVLNNWRRQENQLLFTFLPPASPRFPRSLLSSVSHSSLPSFWLLRISSLVVNGLFHPNTASVLSQFRLKQVSVSGDKYLSEFLEISREVETRYFTKKSFTINEKSSYQYIASWYISLHFSLANNVNSVSYYPLQISSLV